MKRIDKIQKMSKAELVNFLNDFNLEDMNGVICRDCMKRNNGCPMQKDDECLYVQDSDMIGYWLDMEVE